MADPLGGLASRKATHTSSQSRGGALDVVRDSLDSGGPSCLGGQKIRRFGLLWHWPTNSKRSGCDVGQSLEANGRPALPVSGSSGWADSKVQTLPAGFWIGLDWLSVGPPSVWRVHALCPVGGDTAGAPMLEGALKDPRQEIRLPVGVVGWNHFGPGLSNLGIRKLPGGNTRNCTVVGGRICFHGMLTSEKTAAFRPGTQGGSRPDGAWRNRCLGHTGMLFQESNPVN